MTHLHEVAGSLRDGAIGFAADGSRVELAIARQIEIMWAHSGVVSFTLTRFFRSLEAAPINVELTLLAPLGAGVRRLTARIGERSSHPTLSRQAEAPYAAAPISYMARPHGAHVVALRALPPGQEMRVDARIVAPLSMSGAAPRLRLPMTFADALRPRTSRGAQPTTAVLIVSRRAGVTLLEGRPIGDSPAIVCGDAPLELVFPEAGEGS